MEISRAPVSDETGAQTTGAPVGCRPPPTLERLRELVAGNRHAEAAALLEQVELGADLTPDWFYYAGVAFNGSGQPEPAFGLLKRAAEGGFQPFWCAYQLGLCEIGRGNPAAAAFYLTAALILSPLQADVIRRHLARVAPGIKPAALDAARSGERSSAAAAIACEVAQREQQAGNAGVAAHYFTAALAMDPERDKARAALLNLAPDAPVDLLPSVREADWQRRQARGPFLLVADRELSLQDLQCASVLEAAKQEMPSRVARVDFGSGGKPIEAAAVDNVLYLPELKLQIWRDTIVPEEANTACVPLAHLQWEFRKRGYRPVMVTDYSEIREPVCILSNLWSYANFYHFFEELFKVTILEKHRFRGSYVIADPPRFVRELLALLGIGPDRVIECAEPTLFRTAYFATPVSPGWVLSYPGLFMGLREALRRVARGPSAGSRLWIDRRGQRPVVNADQVERILDRYGFTSVDMAALPVAEQIAAVKQAEILAGPHGAGMIHAMFLSSRSPVVECFSPAYVSMGVLDICHILRHRYFQLVPVHHDLVPYAYGIDVSVDCTHLDLILRDLTQAK